MDSDTADQEQNTNGNGKPPLVTFQILGMLFCAFLALGLLLALVLIDGEAIVHIIIKAMNDFADRCDQMFPM